MALQTNYMNAQPVQQGGLLAARQQRDANTWKQMLDVAKMDTQTAAGFGLGRLLSQWWNRYQEKKNDPNNQAWEAAKKQKGEYDSFDAQINDIAGQITGLQQANDAIDNPQPQYNLANDVQTVGQNLAAQGYQNPADEAFKAKSLPDMAFFDGVKKEKNNQQIESLKARQAELTQKRDAIGQMLAQSGILGATPQEQAMQQASVNNRYLSGLLNFQNAYADAQSRGDQAGMDAAHAGAMDWREQGRAAGIDPALLDERLNPQQVQEIMRQNEWGSVFNSMNSDDMYQLTFNRARANGMSFTEAKALAGDAAAKYQAQRVAAMSNATLKYGIGEDGALNAMGVQGIAQLAQISPETANALANMLPGMKDAYTKKTQQELLGLNHGYHQDDMVLGGKIDMAKEDQKHAHDEETKNNDVSRAIAKAQALVGVKLKGSQIEFEQRFLNGQALDLKGKDLIIYALTGKIGSSKDKGSSSGTSESEVKMSDLKTIAELRDKWNEEHSGQEWANPYEDIYEKKMEAANGYTDAPEDINNYNSVNKWATDVVQENRRQGYKYPPDALKKMIASVGGYGPQIAEEFEKDGIFNM